MGNLFDHKGSAGALLDSLGTKLTSIHLEGLLVDVGSSLRRCSLPVELKRQVNSEQLASHRQQTGLRFQPHQGHG